jgi:ribosomal protein L1
VPAGYTASGDGVVRIGTELVPDRKAPDPRTETMNADTRSLVKSSRLHESMATSDAN